MTMRRIYIRFWRQSRVVHRIILQERVFLMLYIFTFMAGGLFGVVTMCLFQINRHESEMEYRRDQTGEGNSEGGSRESA